MNDFIDFTNQHLYWMSDLVNPQFEINLPITEDYCHALDGVFGWADIHWNGSFFVASGKIHPRLADKLKSGYFEMGGAWVKNPKTNTTTIFSLAVIVKSPRVKP